MLINHVLVNKNTLLKRKSFWLSKGYNLEDEYVNVNVDDLSSGSHIVITYTCDYCNTELSCSYKLYLKRKQHFHKDCCSKCIPLKIKEIKELLSDEEKQIKSKIHGKHISESRCKRSEKQKNLEKERRKQTNLKLFGVENPYQNEEIKNKIRYVLLNSYGVDNPSKSHIIRNKIINTYNNNYGSDHFRQSREYRQQSFDNFVTNLKQNNIETLTSFDTYFMSQDKLEFKCLDCNNNFDKEIIYGLKYNLISCPHCISYNRSKGEKEILNFIQSLNIKVKPNDRQILSGKEIDLLMYDHMIGLEYNGLIWHSEIFGNKDRHYHINKLNLAKENNINLFFIYDFEWANKKEIVKSIIKNKLSIIDNKIFARKCIIKEITYFESRTFFNENHIQGAPNISSSMIHLGLYYDSNLVCCLSFSKPRFNKSYEWELYRFANKINTQVIGGFSKLLKYFEVKYNPKSIITYSEKRLFNNNTYEKNGFTYLKSSDPGYFYIQNNKYIGSRYQFQKHKLPTLLENYEPSLSEWENMKNNGYDRVWDCGNRVFIKHY